MKKLRKFLLFALSAIMAMSVFAGCTPKDNDDDDKTGGTYNFYMTCTTLPTQYAVFNTFLDDTESYMWFGRADTFNVELLPVNVRFVGEAGIINVSNMLREARNVLIRDPEAKINFFVDDLSIQFFLDVVISAGYEEGSYKLILLPDGTGTYNTFANDYVKATDDASKAEFDKYLTEYNELFDEYYENGETFVGYTKSTNPNRLKKAGFAVASLDYAEYWLQITDFFDQKVVSLPKLKAAYKSCNIVEKQPKDILDALSADDRERAIESVIAGAATAMPQDNAITGFLEISAKDWTDAKATPAKIANETATEAEIEFLESLFAAGGIAYDPAKFDSLVSELYKKALAQLGKNVFDEAFDTTSPGRKPKNLMIIGSSFDSMGVGADGSNLSVLVDVMTAVVNDFGNDYNLIFKGHPIYPIIGEKRAELEALGITFIPWRTPAEVIGWAYDTYMGGYASTTYMGTEPSKLIFGIGNSITSAGGKYVLTGWTNPLPSINFENIQKCYKLDGTLIEK